MNHQACIKGIKGGGGWGGVGGVGWVGWGERTQVWFRGAEPDTETAPAPFQPLGSLSVPL